MSSACSTFEANSTDCTAGEMSGTIHHQQNKIHISIRQKPSAGMLKKQHKHSWF